MEWVLSPFEILLAFAITLTGATLQGSIGFGLGPFAVPLLVLHQPRHVPGPLLLSALFLTLLLTCREHEAIHLEGLKWAIPGRIAGSIIGAGLLLLVPREDISLLFGAMVLLAVLISVVGIELQITPVNIFSAGTMSGLMGTTSAIGGPPMALVYQKQKGSRIRGTLSSIFVFGTVVSLVSLAAVNRFGLMEVRLALLLLPGILLGFLLSSRTARILDRGLVRPAVLVTSAVSGIIVILKSLF